MPGNYVIKRTSDGKYVARIGSEHSYTTDRLKAAEFNSAEAARNNACGNESVWREPHPVLISSQG